MSLNVEATLLAHNFGRADSRGFERAAYEIHHVGEEEKFTPVAAIVARMQPEWGSR